MEQVVGSAVQNGGRDDLAAGVGRVSMARVMADWPDANTRAAPLPTSYNRERKQTVVDKFVCIKNLTTGLHS